MSDTDIGPNVPNFKYMMGYAAAFVFLIGIMIYIYMLVVNYLETQKTGENPHSVEEMAWIWGFLVILILGFIISYYTISQSIQIEEGYVSTVENVLTQPQYPKQYPKQYTGRGGLSFGGKKILPARRAYGKHGLKTISSFSKLIPL